MHVCGPLGNTEDASEREVSVPTFKKPNSDPCGQAQNVVIFFFKSASYVLNYENTKCQILLQSKQ